jgi:seryl-tRNA synthetase
MIDIKILRNNPEIVRDSINKRNLKIDLDALIQRDSIRVAQQQELDLLRARRNELSSNMGKGKPDNTVIEEAKMLKEKIQTLELVFMETEEEYKLMLASLPNFLDPTAAIGPDDSGNVIENTV